MNHDFRNLSSTNSASLGLLYKKIRSEAGYTQEQLAKILGVRPSTISACELKGQLSIEMLNRYADHFKVSTDFLLGRTAIRHPHQTVRAICKALGIREEAVAFLVNEEKKKKGNKLKTKNQSSELSSCSANTYSEFLSFLITDQNFVGLCNSFNTGVRASEQAIKDEEMANGINSRTLYNSYYFYECMQHFMAFLRSSRDAVETEE